MNREETVRLGVQGVVIALLVLGCGGGTPASSPGPPRADGPMGVVQEEGMPPGMRLPGEPLRASVGFHAPLTAETVRALLARHDVSPYLAQAWGGGVGIYAQVAAEAADPAVVTEAHRMLVERLESSHVCALPARLRSYLQEERATGRAPREVLSRVLDEREALLALRAGGPSIWAVYVTGRAADVVELAGDPLVRVLLAEDVVVQEGVRLSGVPRPPEPDPVGRIEVRADVAELSEQEVRQRLETLAVEPVPASLGCPPGGPRNQDVPPADRPFGLATEAAADWRVRELAHAPRYFQLDGWKDAGVLMGRAGCNPVEVQVGAPEYLAWDVSACGGATLAPDGRRLAWSDGTGAIRVGERGGAQRLLLPSGTASPSGEGDPTGLVLWSPDASRFLTSWAAEWDASFAVVDAGSGAPTPLATRLEGHFLTTAWGWLDHDRILFTVQASRDRDGEATYREGGGHRADLAVYDLRDGTFRRVSAVADGVFLRPLGPWGDGAILVGERGEESPLMERFGVYDTARWQRRPVALPPATDVLVADSSRVLVVRRPMGPERGDGSQLHLWSGVGSDLLLLARVRGAGTFRWSPDRARLAVATTFEEPEGGLPGSLRSVYRAWVIEPR